MFFDQHFGHNVLTYHLYNSKKGLSITTWITTYYIQCTIVIFGQQSIFT